MFRIRKRNKTKETRPNLVDNFDRAHLYTVRSLLNVMRYVPLFQDEFARLKPNLSPAQLVALEPLFHLAVTPSFPELLAHAERHNIITAEEAQRLPETALKID